MDSGKVEDARTWGVILGIPDHFEESLALDV